MDDDVDAEVRTPRAERCDDVGVGASASFAAHGLCARSRRDMRSSVEHAMQSGSASLSGGWADAIVLQSSRSWFKKKKMFAALQRYFFFFPPGSIRPVPFVQPQHCTR